jgi:hypothetical protein
MYDWPLILFKYGNEYVDKVDYKSLWFWSAMPMTKLQKIILT